MKIPVFSINADFIDKYQSPVFHKYEIEYFLYVHFPKEMNRDYELFQVDEVSPTAQKVPMGTFIEREFGKPWINIKSGILNLDIGKHIYRLSFVNKYSNDVVSLYFGYIIQDDKPDKPYIYMKGVEGC